MTVRELRNRLRVKDGDAEIRMTIQPDDDHPLQYEISDLAEIEEDGKTVFYIIDGEHPESSQYAPAAVFE